MMRTMLAIALASLGAATAHAQEARDPGAPRALVVVVPAPGGDAFLPAWLYEVAAGELRSAGWSVPPRNAAAELLTEDGEACASSDACMRDLAARARSPVVVLVRLAPTAAGRTSIAWSSAVLDERGIVRSEPQAAEGDETALASALRASVSTLASAPKPCAVELAAPPQLISELTIDARPVTVEPRFFVSAGEHALHVAADGRVAFDGALSCREGRALRVRAR